MSTLDQQRAQFAWDAVNAARRALPKFDEYKNLAKGAPALVMGNGLMAALAFYQSRGKDHAARLLNDISAHLVTRFTNEPAFKPLPTDFKSLMERLQKVDSSFYMAATDEVLAMLKWLRQFADALDKGTGDAP